MIILTKPFHPFKTESQQLTAEANELMKTAISNEQELNELKQSMKDWQQKVLTFFNQSFSEDAAVYKNDFLDIQRNFHIPGMNPPLNRRVENIREQLRGLIYNLDRIVRIIGVCDAVIDPDGTDIEERDKYTVKQKMDLILNKLYDLNDGNYYPVNDILKGNGIVLRHSNEDRDLLEKLENIHYIERYPAIGADLLAKLTVEGAMIVEDSRSAVIENYEDIDHTSQQLQAIINNIHDELNKVQLGQEILFDELQELKDLYGKLSKKNWGQLLKGKLIDLALSKVVDNVTIAFVYKAFTHHDLHLL